VRYYHPCNPAGGLPPAAGTFLEPKLAVRLAQGSTPAFLALMLTAFAPVAVWVVALLVTPCITFRAFRAGRIVVAQGEMRLHGLLRNATVQSTSGVVFSGDGLRWRSSRGQRRRWTFWPYLNPTLLPGINTRNEQVLAAVARLVDSWTDG
jgi:hypothetical protein